MAGERLNERRILAIKLCDFYFKIKKYGVVLLIIAFAGAVFRPAVGELHSFLHRRGAAIAGTESSSNCSSSSVALAHSAIHSCVPAPAQSTAAVNNGTSASLPSIVMDGATVCPAYGESPTANDGESVC